MKQVFVVLLFLLLSFVCVNAQESCCGNYMGSYSTIDGDEDALSAQVIAKANDSCLAIITIGDDTEYAPQFQLEGTKTGDKNIFEGKIDLGSDMGGSYDIEGWIKDSIFEGNFSGVETSGQFKLEKVFIKSSTLGSKPPEGAVVLFDGEDLDAWEHKGEKKASWKMTIDGAMEVTKGNIISKQTFGNQQVHVEFKTPLMPDQSGQARGNSGVYLQGKYEVQILDSFGLEPGDDYCGAIYKVATPLKNTCLPPGEWQTYDITFYEPQFDKNGDKVKEAVITVKHNGILIQSNVKIPGPTRASMINDEKIPGGLMLQDHGNPVQFRNIWILPL